MSPLLLLILIILTFSKNNDSYVFENKGTLIQEQKAVQTILPIFAFFFLFCCPATYNRENRSSNPLAALTILILIILVFGNDEKLRRGVSGQPPARPYKKQPTTKPYTRKQSQALYQGKDSQQHGLNALTILMLILLQYGQGSYHGQDRKPNSKPPVIDYAFSTNNETGSNLDDMAPMDPNKENLLLIYLSILAALNLKETDEPAKDINVRIIDNKAVVSDFVSPVNPQIDVTPLPPQPIWEPDDTGIKVLPVPVCDPVTYPATQNEEVDTELDNDFVDAFIEQEEPPKVEDEAQEEAPLEEQEAEPITQVIPVVEQEPELITQEIPAEQEAESIIQEIPAEQEAESIIQEINDVINTTPETEHILPEVFTEPILEVEKSKETVVPADSDSTLNTSEMDTPLASVIQNDYEGSFVTTLLSNLVAAGGEVIFHFNNIISLKLGDRIYFINEKDLLGFY